MKLLTKNTDYAVRALLVLASNKEKRISARDIANKEAIPYQFMRKIMQVLISEGYVESKEGGHGGFKLIEKPEKIRMVDIIRIFQGKVQLSECVFRKQICHKREACVLRDNIKKIEDIVKKEFEGITIKSLMDDLKK